MVRLHWMLWFAFVLSSGLARLAHPRPLFFPNRPARVEVRVRVRVRAAAVSRYEPVTVMVRVMVRV